MKSVKSPLIGLALLLGLAIGSQAAVIIPTSVYAHNITGGGGISSVSNEGDEFDAKPDADDPSTWTATVRSWQNDWQGNDPLTAGTNGKVGWIAFDFNSVQALDEIYIWNLREATAQNRRVITYNIYYANSPSVALASGPSDNNSVDYDFSSGGWTQLGSTRTLTQATNGPDPANGVETLGLSAQYIGLEFITYGGASDRVGLAEVVFTETIPEPSVALLGSLGLLMLLRRRKH